MGEVALVPLDAIEPPSGVHGFHGMRLTIPSLTSRWPSAVMRPTASVDAVPPSPPSVGPVPEPP